MGEGGILGDREDDWCPQNLGWLPHVSLQVTASMSDTISVLLE